MRKFKRLMLNLKLSHDMRHKFPNYCSKNYIFSDINYPRKWKISKAELQAKNTF